MYKSYIYNLSVTYSFLVGLFYINHKTLKIVSQMHFYTRLSKLKTCVYEIAFFNEYFKMFILTLFLRSTLNVEHNFYAYITHSIRNCFKI